MRKRSRKILPYILVLGVFFSFLVSEVWPPSLHQGFVPKAGSSTVSPATEDGPADDLLPEKPFRLPQLPLQGQEVEPRPAAPQQAPERGLGEIMKQAQDKDLTLREQLAVLRIAYTRLSAEERRWLLKMFREGASMEEALDAYRLLQERLTEEELILTLSLIRRYREELQQLIRR